MPEFLFCWFQTFRTLLLELINLSCTQQLISKCASTNQTSKCRPITAGVHSFSYMPFNLKYQDFFSRHSNIFYFIIHIYILASCKMGAGSFPGVKCGRGVLLTTYHLLMPRSRKSRALTLPTL